MYAVCMSSDNIIRKPKSQTDHTFTADEIELVKSLAPRIRDLVAAGREPGDALLDALREARDTFARLQADADFRAAFVRTAAASVWVAAKTERAIAEATR